jgi:hypothetical protein
VRIAATADIYVSFTGTAAIPGDVTDGTASELLPIRAAIIGSTFASRSRARSPSACSGDPEKRPRLIKGRARAFVKFAYGK